MLFRSLFIDGQNEWMTLAFLITAILSDKLRLCVSFQSSHVTFVTLVNIVTSPKACFRTKKTPTNQAIYIVERLAFCGRLVKNYELRREDVPIAAGRPKTFRTHSIV